jgi:mRNA interferase RelE/StbE
VIKHYIDFKRTAIKDLEKINRKDSIRIIQGIEHLHEGLSGDIKKLTNFTPEYRLRIGKFRILFELNNARIIIYRIKQRKESYK